MRYICSLPLPCGVQRALWELAVLAAETLLKTVAALQAPHYLCSPMYSGNAPCSQVGHHVKQHWVPSSLRARALNAAWVCWWAPWDGRTGSWILPWHGE